MDNPVTTQKRPLHTQKRRCLLPVIARSEATGQSASLQRNRTNWLLFGRIRKPLRIRLNHCLLFCVAAGERIATGVRTGSQRHAKTWPVFALARGNARWKVPGKLLKTPLHTQKRRCLLPVIARSEATGQSASPQRSRTNWLLFGRIHRRLRIYLFHLLRVILAVVECLYHPPAVTTPSFKSVTSI